MGQGGKHRTTYSYGMSYLLLSSRVGKPHEDMEMQHADTPILYAERPDMNSLALWVIHKQPRVSICRRINVTKKSIDQDARSRSEQLR